MAIPLRQIFSRYTGTLRSWKWVYQINNLLHRRQLRHNRPLYQQYGLERSIYSSIGAKDFPPTERQQRPWLDQPDALERLEAHPEFDSFSPALQESMRGFVRDGYLVLPGFYSAKEVEQLDTEIEQLLSDGTVVFNFTGRKIMDAHTSSALIDRQYYRNAELIQLLEFLMGRPVVPFQSINFRTGSEQRAHSDSIHMMTQPEGYLIAAWTALEATGPDNGALFYYPGSHRLPILTCEDYDAGHTRYRLGERSYQKYEEAIEALIEREGLEKRVFHAQPGDVFIWHANLLHGGSPIGRPGSSRRSMVAHYFCEGVICYHEISQRPALLKPGSSQ